MADGVVHERDTIITGATVLTSSIALYTLDYITIEHGLYACLGALGGILITPDADHHMLTVEEQRMGKLVLAIFGKSETTKKIAFMLNGLHKFFLSPYSIFLKHRSVFSHLPVLGTFLRIVYLYILYCFFTGITGIQFAIFNFIDLINTNTLIMFGIWCIQDFIHAWRDNFKFIW